MPNYTHPTIETRVTEIPRNFTEVETTNSALFAPFTSDKGLDNEIVRVTSASEFTYLFGEPNFRNHGQAAYNIVNWLNGGGEAYVMRVLPEDAGHSNLTLNVQLFDNGDDTFEYRTAVYHSEHGNTSEKEIKSDLERDRTTAEYRTLDGFVNYPLFTFYTNGRGDLDTYGIRLNVSDSFNNTYDFRTYTVEILQMNASGGINIVEGPFEVSLYPDAYDKNGNSLFIVDVLEDNSNHMNVLFNEDNYNALKGLLLDTANADDFQKFDILYTSTREVAGVNETITVSGADQDVHYKVANFIAQSSIADLNVLTNDNSKRAETMSIQETNDTIYKDLYTASAEDPSSVKLSTDYTTLHAEITAKDTALDSEASNVSPLGEATYKDSSSRETLTNYFSALQAFYLEANKAYPYHLITGQDTTTLTTTIQDLPTKFWNYKKNELEYQGYITDLANLGTQKNEATTNAKKIEYITEAKAELDKMIASLDLPTGTAPVGQNIDYASKQAEIDTYISNLGDEDLVANHATYITNAISAIDTIIADIDDDLLESLNKKNHALVPSVTFDPLNDIASTTAVNSAWTTILAGDRKTAVKTEWDNHKLTNATVNAKFGYTLNLVDTQVFANVRGGSIGSLKLGSANRQETIDGLYKRAFSTSNPIDDAILNRMDVPYNVILDANFADDVKLEINELVTGERSDTLAVLDTKTQNLAADAVSYRSSILKGVNSANVAIYTQSFIIKDNYTLRDIEVTPTYFLASKMPQSDKVNGIHFALAGINRGLVTGFKELSFNPTKSWKEQLYKNQINYIERDARKTKFGSQLTSKANRTALSFINNTRVLLQIKRDVELMAEGYQFEFNDNQTLTAFNTRLNDYLDTWLSNRACSTILGTVYASAYDRQNGKANVRIELTFTGTIEQISIEIQVG